MPYEVKSLLIKEFKMEKFKSISTIILTSIILTGCNENNLNNAVMPNNNPTSIPTDKASSINNVSNLSTGASINETKFVTTAVPIQNPNNEKTFNSSTSSTGQQPNTINNNKKSTVQSPEIRKQNEEFRKMIERDYAKTNSISLGEAKKRLAIMGNDDAVSMVKEYFGEDLTGIYYGLDDKGNFGLNVRAIKRKNRSAEDNNFVKSVFDKTNVPINIQSNSSLSEKQIDESIKLNYKQATKILPSIQTIGYSPIEDAIYIIFFDENKKYNDIEISNLETQLSTLFGYKVKLEQLERPSISAS